jgi:hypothetical protein
MFQLQIQNLVSQFAASIVEATKKSIVESVAAAVAAPVAPAVDWTMNIDILPHAVDIPATPASPAKTIIVVPRRGKARAPGEKRSPELLVKTVTALFEQIKSTPGQRIEQIGAALKIPTKELMLPARKLIATKQVRTEGQKRATKYFLA